MPRDNQISHDLRLHKRLLVNLPSVLAALLVMAILYVLSYPFAVRWTRESDMRVFRPVQWIIDETAVREPMFRLADACGCGEAVRDASFERTLLIRDRHWQIDMPAW